MHQFKGFDDFIEIFEGGWQTDSQGRTRYWSEQDLDQLVANHNADDPFPAVIGHPATAKPAYGWGQKLKRSGMKVLAKFGEIEPQFAQMVEQGRFKKRSSSIGKNNNGEFFIRHVGWLGAKAPAVEGLAHPTFSDDAAEVFEFEVPVDWRTPNFLKRVVQNLRELSISQFGMDVADRFFPSYMADEVGDLADSARNSNPADPDFAASFSQHDDDDGDPAVPKPKNGNQPGSDTQTFTQADVDAAIQAERDKHASELEAERRARRLHEHQDFVADLNIPPALGNGMAEFMLSLSEADDAQFEFLAEKKKQTPLEFYKAQLGQLKGKFDHLFEERGGGDDAETSDATYDAAAGYSVDPDALAVHNKAMEYMQKNDGVEYVQAVQIVERQGA